MSLLFSNEQYFEANPYFENIEYTSYLLDSLVNDKSTLMLDSISNPELAINQSIHFIDGKDTRSDVARALEGEVLAADWKQSHEVTAHEMALIEQNSSFFILVEKTEQGPKTVGALRIASVLHDSDATETKNFFKLNNPDASIPEGLNIQHGDKNLWDIVGVVTDKEHRDGRASNWLYHALYKKSVDLRVPYWISNVHDKEFKNLNLLGIPFRLIEGTNKVEVPTGNKVLKFGFYALRVENIRSEMELKIAELESTSENDTLSSFKRLIASMSRIAINGSTQ